MLDDAAAGNTIPKDDFTAAVPDLRVRLLNAQFDLSSADFAVVVVLAGDDRLGANELVNRLNEWLDSRFLDTSVFTVPEGPELARPAFSRLWDALPPAGRMSLWVGGLMRQVRAHLDGEVTEAELRRWCDHLRRTQEAWIADGALVLKFYLHTPAAVQKKRYKKRRKRDDAWRYDHRDWEMARSLDAAVPTIETVLRETSVTGAPWTIVEGTDKRYRDLSVARTILAALEARLASPPPATAAGVLEQFADLDQQATVLDHVDLSATVTKDDYRAELARLQGRLHRLADRARRRGVSTVLAFEGWDAAGKGGAIRRITPALEAGDYRVHAVAAPTEEERRYHYLWRFWRDVPRDGRVAIFDRTWYGRVLVERVEGFASPAEWQRAYDEILDFEAQLVEHGVVLAKFWVHISPEEQLARFEARRDTPYKKYKITEEDYRNREKWDAYVAAVDQMVVRTSMPDAPWHIVAGNDKRYARLAVLREVVAGLERAVG